MDNFDYNCIYQIDGGAPVIPKVQKSEGFLYRRVVIPNTQIPHTKGPLVRNQNRGHNAEHMCRYSEGSESRSIVISKVRYYEGSLFRKKYRVRFSEKDKRVAIPKWDIRFATPKTI